MLVTSHRRRLVSTLLDVPSDSGGGGFICRGSTTNSRPRAASAAIAFPSSAVSLPRSSSERNRMLKPPMAETVSRLSDRFLAMRTHHAAQLRGAANNAVTCPYIVRHRGDILPYGKISCYRTSEK